MRCPYCEEENCVPEEISKHVEEEGSTKVLFSCIHCKNGVKATGIRVATFGNPEKLNEGDF